MYMELLSSAGIQVLFQFVLFVTALTVFYSKAIKPKLDATEEEAERKAHIDEQLASMSEKIDGLTTWTIAHEKSCDRTLEKINQLVTDVAVVKNQMSNIESMRKWQGAP